MKNKHPEPIINETNRESWKNKILSKNPWLEQEPGTLALLEDLYDERPMLFEDNQ